MIDDLHRDPPGFGSRERARCVAIKRSPRIGVNFRLQRRFKGAIGVASTEEIRVSNEEALLVVVRIDEPTRPRLRRHRHYEPRPYSDETRRRR